MTVVRRAHERGITTLALDAPERRNALSAQLVAELADALTECGKDGDVRAVVLTHTGNTFSAGADLRDPPHPDVLVALLRQIVELPKPVVARVTGHVRAGGLGLLGACDIAVASQEATFAFTEVRIGVAPAVISLPLLPLLDPRAVARYYLTGRSSTPPRPPGSASSRRRARTPTTYSRPCSTDCGDPPRKGSPRRNGCSRLRCWTPSTGTRPTSPRSRPGCSPPRRPARE